jgi:hypothetical protein
MASRSTCFNANQASRQYALKELHQLRPSEAPSQHARSFSVDAMNLEDPLPHVEGANLQIWTILRDVTAPITLAGQRRLRIVRPFSLPAQEADRICADLH